MGNWLVMVFYEEEVKIPDKASPHMPGNHLCRADYPLWGGRGEMHVNCKSLLAAPDQ
jgi:hypothetical protein